MKVSGNLIIPDNVSKTGRDANCERFCLVLEFRLRSEQDHGRRPSGNQRPATSRAFQEIWMAETKKEALVTFNALSDDEIAQARG